MKAPVPRTRVSGRDDGAAAGGRIKIFCDYCGGHWIELTPCWQFWSKRRRLTPTGMFEIRSCRKIAALGRAAIMSLFE